MPETLSGSEARRALLEKRLRKDISPGVAAIDPSVARAPAAVAEQRESVVAIQTGGSETPIYFLHGQYDLGGFYCYRLAQALGPDRPFYALEPFQFEGLSSPPPFHAIAAAHLKSLRAVAPQGPYILGGWCNGALLAYEMARQLHAEGQVVENLVLLDAVYLRYPWWLRLVRSTIIGLGALIRRGPDEQLRAYLRLRHGYRQLRDFIAYVRSPGYRKQRGSGRFVRDDYPGIYDWTAMAYKPESLYPGKITFLWSSTRPTLIHGFRVTRYRSAWRKVEAGSEVVIQVLPFSHWTALSENLDGLAERMRSSLISAQRLGRLDQRTGERAD